MRTYFVFMVKTSMKWSSLFPMLQYFETFNSFN